MDGEDIRQDGAANDGAPAKIVGIGASAGGLEAFTELLRHLPIDAGVAYVLVQHLDPTHPSLLSELLGKATTLPVREVKEGTAVMGNNIYVIPPNCDLAIRSGVLKLSPRERGAGPARSIDSFLKSLAEDQGERAIGVILSGAGSDGSQGLKAIKEAGGITFAQDDRSAKYDSMPRSALSTGCVDFVLPPQKIAEEIARIILRPDASKGRAAANAKTRRSSPRMNSRASGPMANFPPAPEDANLRKLFQMLRAKTAVDFGYYKPNTIRRRLARRMGLCKVANIEGYLKFIRDNPPELEALHRDFLINVTNFFRNPRVFETLKRRVFPKLIKNYTGADPLRFWVAGCSTGQEAYSMAMAYAEFAEQAATAVNVQIFATDVNAAVLDQARSGRYSTAMLEGVSETRRQKFFFKEDGHFRVSKPIRDMVVFAQQNLLLDPPFTRVDLVSCRNVLIYLDSAIQQKIIPTFHYALKPNGYLLLGTSESAASFHTLFDSIEKAHRVYLKKPASTWLYFDRPPSVPSLNRTTANTPTTITREEFSLLDAQKEADRVLLSSYTPASVLINDAGDVLQFRGPADRFLHVPSGKASFQLPKMVGETLAAPLERAIKKARAESRTALERDVPFDKKKSLLDIEVVPLRNLRAKCFLVIFRPIPARLKALRVLPELKGARAADAKTLRQVAELKHDLLESRERYNALQEEHETSTEELQASNEEVQSANEELQSLNEELETSNEELESANEELTTLNEELATRNTELRESEQRLREQAQLLEMAPILARSAKDRIIFWSRGAEKMYGFSSDDAVGQIAHILLGTEFPQPIEKIQSELLRHGHWEGEVRHRRKDGHVISVATQWVVQHDEQNKVRAVLEVNTDITDRIEAEQNLARTEQFNRSILKSSPDCITVLDLDGRMIFSNPPDPSHDFPDFKSCGERYWPGCWLGVAREPADLAYREGLAGKRSHFEAQYPTAKGVMKWWDVVIGPILGLNGKPEKLLCVARDITEHKLVEMATVERSKRAALRAEIALQVASTGPLNESLQRVTDALVQRLGLSFARIWTLADGAEELELRASAGMYTHLDGAHSRIKLGQKKIGRIASTRQPVVTNDVQHDNEISDREWAKRERMIAFAGFPMIVNDRVVGVLGVFSRHAMPEASVLELNFSAEAVGQLIQRKQAEQSLRNAEEQLRDYASNLERKVRERTASLQEVISQLEEFSYSVSHDLRAPLRAMQGYATAILEDYGERMNQPGKAHLDRIIRNASRMDRLIQDILTYSRLGRQDIRLNAVPLAQMVEEVIQHRPEINSLGVDIKVGEIHDTVLCHEPSLAQAIFNLLSNAIKFVAPGTKPEPRIWAERRDKHVRLWVQDNGIGIKPEYQSRLFGVFERIHPDTKYEGTGIGLAIVRKAVERMNGKVGVESDGINGSKFWIEIPAAENGES